MHGYINCISHKLQIQLGTFILYQYTFHVVFWGTLKLQVKDNLGGTRKLRDFGVYKATNRNYDEIDASEEYLIKSVTDFDFAKV